MSQNSGSVKEPAEEMVQSMRRATRKRYSAGESAPGNAIGAREQANRIVLEGLRGEDGIAGLCRREGISRTLDDRWSKEFLG